MRLVRLITRYDDDSSRNENGSSSRPTDSQDEEDVSGLYEINKVSRYGMNTSQ